MNQFLLRLARAVLNTVLTQLMQQFNVVQDQALSPMRMMVQQVTGGVWRGQGANAFVDEVSSLMIPGVGVVGNNITTIGNNIRYAVDVMDRADQQVNTLVNSLGDVFSGIYK
jgi:uncharacterized protein YukE